MAELAHSVRRVLVSDIQSSAKDSHESIQRWSSKVVIEPSTVKFCGDSSSKSIDLDVC